ncbi:MAG: geranylgeranylglyceryl/heptaprenylglyceryl phosphate synthase [Candidatus Methanomethylophilus sp.]|nr:geranylgeranylglyceryl/heptaprenylglyceryl phosphate synthase [Methanomethylophilus sp.]
MIDVKEYIKEKTKNGTMHLTLLDPDPAKLNVENAKVIARKLQDAGTDAFLIGGSTGVTTESLDAITIAVREETGLPTIYFPSDVHAISDEVDAMLFMSIVNSSNPKYITHYHAKAAPYVKMLGIQTIPMAYIVVEPGMTVGRVSEAKLIPRDDVESATGFAIAAELLGMQLVYLEAGSGADKPVPPEMIETVKMNINVPLIVGGGIRTPEAAAAAREAGADIIVTGTFVEQCSDDSLLRAVVKAAKGI